MLPIKNHEVRLSGTATVVEKHHRARKRTKEFLQIVVESGFSRHLLGLFWSVLANSDRNLLFRSCRFPEWLSKISDDCSHELSCSIANVIITGLLQMAAHGGVERALLKITLSSSEKPDITGNKVQI